MAFLYYVSIFLFLIVSILLCGVILLQESKTMGLGASFGGDAGESLFGTGTADVLKKFTGYLAVVFLGACVVMSLWTSAMERTRTEPGPVVIEEVE